MLPHAIRSALVLGCLSCVVDPAGEPPQDDKADFGGACEGMRSSKEGWLESGDDCDGPGTMKTDVADQVTWFYSLHVRDTESCNVDPRIFIDVAAGVEVCIRYDCDEGQTQISCPGTIRTYPNGLTECCSTIESPNLGFASLNCTGTTSESGIFTVTAHVDPRIAEAQHADAEGCVPFVFTYYR